MTKIIDNSREKLSSALREELSDLSEIAIASAYFNVKGYGAIKQGLADKPLRFLLGREPNETLKWEDEVLRELEQEEDDTGYFELLQEAIRYFENPLREIRVLTGPFFHGKAYIGAYPSLKQIKRGVGVVGSSNFTYGGLVHNRELNMLNTDRQVVEELIRWFDEQWSNSNDYKDTFLAFLKNYITTRSAYEVIAKALYESYKSRFDESLDNKKMLRTLYPHQALSVMDAKEKLEDHNGVLIADATGLGKSRTALSLALDAIKEGKKVLLIAPKSVLDTTWRDEMKGTNIHLESVTSEKLSSDPDHVFKDHSDRNFIIVDEAHFFRTPSTNRYGALRDLIITNKAQVVLATATPVNNSLMDLYFLLSLYLPEDSIGDIYNQTLRGFFSANQKRWLQHEPIEMEQVLERFVVRHSRELAKALDTQGGISFPERVLDKDKRNKYSVDIDYQKIDEILGRMNFAFYDLSVDRLGELKLPDGRTISTISQAVATERRGSLKSLVKTVVIINIFKRLESSVEAFRKTLLALDDYITRATKYAQEKGYFVPPALKEDPIFSLDEEMPSPEDLFSKPKYARAKERCKLTPDEVSDFVSKCEKDRKTVQDLIKEIPAVDAKFESFHSRTAEILKGLVPNNGLIIFTQYTATARYLFSRLRESKSGTIRLATGSDCYDDKGQKTTKTEVIRDFQRTGGVLVSTDVLSEGQNLQNAQYVVNYDFPWNPVVLIQRIGRIDRMKSKHWYVYLINILPKNGDPEDPASLEHFLGLMGKLYSRLEAIRETIGLDATTLGEEAAPKDFGIQEALAKNDQRVLETISRELEQFTADPKDTLAKMINDKGLNWIRTIPNGIGAFKKSDRDGIFVLFSDGKEFYWRLKFYDGKKETISVTNQIVDKLLEGDYDASGEPISYENLIRRMREIKAELKEELESRRAKEITVGGTPMKATQAIKEIYDELAKSGEDGEKLAITFRKLSNRQTLVIALQQARRSGILVKRARELLKEEPQDPESRQQEEIKLSRVCWCWLKSIQ